MRRVSGWTVLSSLVVATLVVLPAGVAGAGRAPRLRPGTVNSAGQIADGDSRTQGTEQLSSDGRLYVFSSKADNLPSGDGSTLRSYRHDFKTGKTKLISTDSLGNPATGEATFPEISPDGKFVGFYGYGDGLPGANGYRQVWLKNLKTGKVRLVSRAANGDPGDQGDSFLPFISANDRFVEFQSIAENLPDNGLSSMIYVRDLKKNTTTMVGRNSAGDPIFANPYGQTLSGDGKFLVFASNDSGLPPADHDYHIYLRNLKTGKTRLVDRAKNGNPPNGSADTPSISQSGRFVAFSSLATNLPGNCPDYCGYIYDHKTGKLKVIRTKGGDPVGGENWRFSADGSEIAFDSTDPAINPNPSLFQTFAKDLDTGKITFLSRNKHGQPGNAFSEFPSISANGRFVAFDSNATNLGGNPPGGSVVEGYRSGPLP